MSYGDLAHIGHVELFTPEPERSRAVLRRGARDGAGGGRGPVGLPPRLRRLPALLAEAHRGARARPRAHGDPRPQRRGARAAGGRDRRDRARPGVDRRRRRPWPRLPLHRPRRPSDGALLRDGALRAAAASAARAEEPAAALHRPRRRRQPPRPREPARPRRRPLPDVRDRHARLLPDRGDRPRRRHRVGRVAEPHDRRTRADLRRRRAGRPGDGCTISPSGSTRARRCCGPPTC